MVRYRRRVSKQNLKNSFPDKSRKELFAIQKASYVYMTDCFFESIKAFSMQQNELIRRVQFSQITHIKDNISNNRPALLLTAHTASSEWIAHAATLEFECPIDPVYKPAHAKFVDRFIFDVRSRYDNTPIPYKNLAKDIVIRKNIKRCIAILADLSPRRREHTIDLNFLNQPTRFFQSIERIAKLSRMPVYYAGIKRKARGNYHVTLHYLSDCTDNLENNELTKKYARLVEQTILENPHAWLWTHRRWKHPCSLNN